jgi:hypothetical protein
VPLFVALINCGLRLEIFFGASFAVQAELFFRLRVNLREAPMLHQQFQTLTVVEVVDELSVVGDFREGETIYELVLPKHTKAPLHHFLTTAAKPDQLRRRGEAIAENDFETV